MGKVDDRAEAPCRWKTSCCQLGTGGRNLKAHIETPEGTKHRTATALCDISIFYKEGF